MSVDKEAILKDKFQLHFSGDYFTYFIKEQPTTLLAVVEAMESYSSELIKENEGLKLATRQLYEEQARQLKSKDKEIERLNALLDSIAKGERMLVNRTGVGEYTVVFKSNDDAAKYYKDNDFENNL